MKALLTTLTLVLAQAIVAHAAEPARVVFIIGENEYETRQTLPEFARTELEPHGLQCRYVHAPPEGGNEFDDWQAIREADLLFVSVRRRTPPAAMMDLIRQHLGAGKALVGIRTASHAWDATPPDAGHAAWPAFDVDVLGMKYEGHYNNKPPAGPRTFVRAVPEAVSHPVLTGVDATEFSVTSHLYKNRRKAGTITPLMTGRLEGRPEVEPVAWVYTGQNRRVFYTSLGNPDDFKIPAFRRLLANGTLWALNRPIPKAERQTSAHTPPEGPLPPDQALRSFHTPDDLEVEQVLAEPVVAQPVFLNFDERGRLWVVQYRQYPHPAGLTMLSRDNVWRAVYDKVPPPPPRHFRGEDRITIHEDTDGDGRFDRHKTFLEGLNIATAVERGRGGVWVLNPPYLLFYPDRNDDDIPDGDPEVRLEGFGLEDTHSVANSLRWGPDGWLYGAQGSTVTAHIIVRGADGRPLNEKPIYSQGQNLWRYHPELRRYEVFSEGGGNAFGVEIDPKGRLFSGHNGGNTRGFHYQQGAYLQKGFEKHGPLSNPYAFGYFPPMPHPEVERFTHNFIVYDGGALPARYDGRLLGVEPLQGRVVLSEITPDKSSFRTRDLGHALTSDDKWFRPVDIKVGPDGAIYVCDWYDRQVNHYRNHEGQIDKANGRIYRIKARGAGPGPRVDLSSLSSAELIGRLDHRNSWQRQHALRILADRREAGLAPRLRARALEATGQGALEAFWAWHLVARNELSEIPADADALAFLGHSDPHVRAWTVRLLGDSGRLSPSLAPALAALATRESHLEVRGQLACTARRLPANYALPIVRGLLSHDEDATDNRMPLLLWWAVEAKADSDREAVLGFLGDPALWNLPLARDHLLERIMRRYAAAGSRQDLLTCARIFDLSPGPAFMARLMAGFEAAFKGRSMANLPDELVNAMAKAGASSVVIGLRRGEPAALTQALALIRDPKGDREKRLQYVAVLGELKASGQWRDANNETASREITEALLQLATRGDDALLGRTALTALQSYDAPSIGTAVVEAIPRLSAEARLGAFTLLASRASWALALLEAVAANKVLPESVPQDVRRKLQLQDNPRHRELYTRLWGAVRSPTTAEMQQQIDRLARLIQTGSGSPYEGQKLYAASCGVCHRLFGQGGQIGPDLTAFKRDDLENMLLNIVHPNAEIREGYENYLLTTRDERTLSGFLAEQDARVVVLRGLDGSNNVVPRAEIAEMKAAGMSLMPEGLLEGLNDQQVRDLFAYLRSTQPLVK